jgi:hypothetical protein
LLTSVPQVEESLDHDFFSAAKELLLFGGVSNGVYMSAIWKYSGQTNLWTKIEDLPFQVAEMAVTPIRGIGCNK